MMKLGGWWRLWIVLSLTYGIAASAIFISSWPRANDISHGPWLTFRLSAASQELLGTASPSMAELISALREADALGDEETARAVADRIIVAREDPSILKPYAAKAPNGHTFELPASATEEQIRAFTADYERVLAAEARTREMSSAKLFAWALLAPPLLVLLVGQAVAWVRRGFQRDRHAS